MDAGSGYSGNWVRLIPGGGLLQAPPQSPERGAPAVEPMPGLAAGKGKGTVNR